MPDAVIVSIEVTAFTTGVPGLVAHPAVGSAAWVLCHSRSGARLPALAFASQNEATAAAGRLAGVVDWTQPAWLLFSLSDLGQRITDALTERPT